MLALLAAHPALPSEFQPPLPRETEIISTASAPAEPSAPGSEAATIVPAVPSKPQEPWRPLSAGERWRYYATETFASPYIVFRVGVPALFAHLDDEPPQWGQGWEAYGKRVGDRYGRFVLRQSFESAAAAALRHEVRYIPSGKSAIATRVTHAVISSVIAKDNSGRWVPHVSRIGAVVAAEHIGNTWMPPGYRSEAEAWRRIGIQFGITASFNVLREFLPDLRRRDSRD